MSCAVTSPNGLEKCRDASSKISSNRIQTCSYVVIHTSSSKTKRNLVRSQVRTLLLVLGRDEILEHFKHGTIFSSRNSYSGQLTRDKILKDQEHSAQSLVLPWMEEQFSFVELSPGLTSLRWRRVSNWCVNRFQKRHLVPLVLFRQKVINIDKRDSCVFLQRQKPRQDHPFSKRH